MIPVLVLLVVSLTSGLDDEQQHENILTIDKQIQIVADVSNTQDRMQPFVYLVKIQDKNDVTVSLAWITGALSPKQTLSPALSWIPEAAGSYTATIYVWESIDNPTALSPPLILPLSVHEQGSG